ncbi:AAA family ATPase [Streptomyces sp. NPDC088775]|uniref:AAA family ATPase n=1 Tax=Streptomyces sp. NPDC088775 TaxID=3365896 RepID=UPI0038290919
MTSVLYPELPENGLIVLIGASGAGKSTLARTWPASQVLSLDGLRGVVSDDPGRQEATGDAADVLKLILERRMARHLNTVIDATSLMIERVHASGEAFVERVARGARAGSGTLGDAAA